MTAKYQPFNDLPAAQFQGLVEDIRRQGVLLPILVDEDDKTIDGHQRRKAAAEAGVECPRIVVTGLSEDEKQTLALTLNLFRRHLAGVERTKALQKLANLGLSTRRMADLLGVSKSTVHNDLQALSNSGQWERPATVTGQDGREQPSTKPERPPSNVDADGVIVEEEGTPPATGSGDGEDVAPGQTREASSASASMSPKLNPGLVLMADLSRLRAEVAKWMAFDKHEQVIESMSQEQRDDYRRFLLSVFNHASATIDILDAPARLTAVK